MIAETSDPRYRPQLDRDYQHNLHVNATTRDTYRDLADDEVSQSDNHEAIASLIRKNPEWALLIKQEARIIANENKKYPKNLPPPTPPKLTPEQAYEILDPVIKREFEKIDQEKPKEKKVTKTVTKPLQTTGMDIWAPIEGALKKRVTEENWGHWLSSVRFLSEDTGKLSLVVPNTFFQEYLTEHYTEVIQEELQEKYRLPYRVEFTVMPQEMETITEELPRVPTLLQLCLDRGIDSQEKREALEDELLPGVYQRRLDEAKRRSGTNEARMAEEVSILKAQRLKEEAARIEFRKKLSGLKTVGPLKQPGTPQSQKQYHKSSAWETEGGVTRKDLS